MAVAPDGSYYSLSGPVDAPFVALVHGLGLNHACWQWLTPALETEFRVLSYDLIGHGQSAPPSGKATLKMLSDQLAALLDHVQVQQAAIVGFSLGGMIARRFAQDHMARTQALVILHSPHRRPASAQADILARVALARRDGPAATVDAALDRWFTPAFRAANPPLMQTVRNWVLANDTGHYPDLYQVLAEGVSDIIAPDPPILCPALVITAEDDFGNGPDQSRAIAAEMPLSELLILPGLRHMALAENPDSVNQPVLAFLRRHL